MNTDNYFYQDGCWWEKIWANQCPYNTIRIKCQGALDHKGEHWQYDSSGVLFVETLDGNAKHSIIPTSDRYVSPRELWNSCYKNIFEIKRVQDQSVIKALNLINGVKLLT